MLFLVKFALKLSSSYLLKNTSSKISSQPNIFYIIDFFLFDAANVLLKMFMFSNKLSTNAYIFFYIGFYLVLLDWVNAELCILLLNKLFIFLFTVFDCFWDKDDGCVYFLSSLLLYYFRWFCNRLIDFTFLGSYLIRDYRLLRNG